MKTKLLITLLLALAPAWVAAQETGTASAPSSDTPEPAVAEGSGEAAPALSEPAAPEPAAPALSEPAAPEPAAPALSEPAAPEPAAPAAGTSLFPASPLNVLAGRRRPARDGLNPLTRVNRNEVAFFVGRHDVTVQSEDRDVLGLEDYDAVIGASMGVRYRNAMGLGGELSYVNWRAADAADVVGLVAHGFDASVRYAWDPIGLVSLYGLAGGGGRWVDMELEHDGAVLSDSAATWTAHAAVGLTVRYSGRRGFIEFYNDHGYEAHGELDFADARYEDSEARPVDVGSVSLGGYRMRWGLSGGVAW